MKVFLLCLVLINLGFLETFHKCFGVFLFCWVFFLLFFYISVPIGRLLCDFYVVFDIGRKEEKKKKSIWCWVGCCCNVWGNTLVTLEWMAPVRSGPAKLSRVMSWVTWWISLLSPDAEEHFCLFFCLLVCFALFFIQATTMQRSEALSRKPWLWLFDFILFCFFPSLFLLFLLFCHMGAGNGVIPFHVVYKGSALTSASLA